MNRARTPGASSVRAALERHPLQGSGKNDHDPFAVDTAAALDELGGVWGTLFRCSYDGGVWHACRKDGTRRTLSGMSPDDLAVKMRAVWAGSVR